MSTAAKPALAPVPLHVLLVGNKEEDFYLIREMLDRTRSMLATELDHALSLEEAKEMLQQKSYGWFCLSTKPETPRRSTSWPSSCMPGCRCLSSC